MPSSIEKINKKKGYETSLIQIVKTRLQSQRRRNFDYDVITNDAYASKNEWLSPGWVITCDGAVVYLSLRGQISRKTPAWQIADWIGDEDINLVTKVSENNDIIAYPIGTDEELVNEILSECNSVPF